MKKTNKLLSTLILTSALLTGLVACGPTSSEDPSNDPSTTNPSVVDVSSIEVTADKTTLIVGDTVNLSINVLPSNATNKNVTYSATGTVEVSSSGTVTAISVGTGSVTVTSVSNPTVSNTINFVVKDANDKSNLPFNEFIEELESTPYSVPTLSGESKFGLNNPSNVGVVEENVVELYPMIADDLADSIINVDSITDSQIASTVTGDTTANDYNKIRTAFALAKANGENDKITEILFTENKDVSNKSPSSPKPFIVSNRFISLSL